MADVGDTPLQHGALVIIRPYLDPPPVKQAPVAKYYLLVIIKPYLDAGPQQTTVASPIEALSKSSEHMATDASESATGEIEQGALAVIKPCMDAAAEQADTSKASPTLLGIPGELRDRIYRLALVEEDYIELDQRRF